MIARIPALLADRWNVIQAEQQLLRMGTPGGAFRAYIPILMSCIRQSWCREQYRSKRTVYVRDPVLLRSYVPDAEFKHERHG